MKLCEPSAYGSVDHELRATLDGFGMLLPVGVGLLVGVGGSSTHADNTSNDNDPAPMRKVRRVKDISATLYPACHHGSLERSGSNPSCNLQAAAALAVQHPLESGQRQRSGHHRGVLGRTAAILFGERPSRTERVWPVTANEQAVVPLVESVATEGRQAGWYRGRHNQQLSSS
jgi:hypothetical protein